MDSLDTTSSLTLDSGSSVFAAASALRLRSNGDRGWHRERDFRPAKGAYGSQ